MIHFPIHSLIHCSFYFLLNNCNCRKPKPGLLIQASHDFNIDLKNSWMLGDHDRDVQSGLNAGCKSVKIDSENSLEKTLHMILSN